MRRWPRGSQNLADAGCAAADDWEPALRFGDKDKVDPLPFEANFERLPFIWNVLPAEVCGDGRPPRRRSRR
jgi:hypothetical protein